MNLHQIVAKMIKQTPTDAVEQRVTTGEHRHITNLQGLFNDRDGLGKGRNTNGGNGTMTKQGKQTLTTDNKGRLTNELPLGQAKTMGVDAYDMYFCCHFLTFNPLFMPAQPHGPSCPPDTH